ncbi:hypothetical protein SAMN06264364_11582 [Quadrisphaera granulorum]|uniref:Uncharacterized protein n=1 Tax=Quadrisphaera granulorum TaxID=317664 RepID=A0A316A8B6_9ACTN|nr:hypothetical protein [Quadrisphaera granulorum]PWJ53064.1 hypothetical protein BXY45_11582 [Quadrisphaera granulorum]SZE97229.1 hypothetical protein SAMN06264364_11582 [Quadrisphaera granulorum]
MRRKTAIVLGVSGAALALTASSAFTAAGLTVSPSAGFIGGTQTVTVNGTTVSSVAYTADAQDAAKTGKIVLTFSDHNANAKVPGIVFTFTSAATTAGRTAPSWTCSAIASVGNTANSASECGAGSSVSGAGGTAFLTDDLVSYALTVS